jgi:GDP-4-dehydro-6-deoxy-D-mannose reductase
MAELYVPEPLGMRILITGAGGFVAPYIAEALRKAATGPCEIVLGVRDAREAAAHNAHVLDLEDAAAIAAKIAQIAPTHIVHLAAVSSLPGAGADPDLAWRVNVGGTLAITRAIRASVPDCVLLFAGSGQVYGETAQLDRAMTEADVLAPMSDYAVTKAAADLALGALAGQGLHCIRSSRIRRARATSVCQPRPRTVRPRHAARPACRRAGCSARIKRPDPRRLRGDRAWAAAFTPALGRWHDQPQFASISKHIAWRARPAADQASIRSVPLDAPAREPGSDLPEAIGRCRSAARST